MRKLNTLPNAGNRGLPNAAERREFENVLQKRKIDRIFENAKTKGIDIGSKPDECKQLIGTIPEDVLKKSTVLGSIKSYFQNNSREQIEKERAEYEKLKIAGVKLSWEDFTKAKNRHITQLPKNFDYTHVPKSNAPVFDKHTIKFDKAGVYTVTVTPDGVTCEPVPKPKPEYSDIFDGTSRLGDVVRFGNILLKREKASSDWICTGCYIHSKRVVECNYTTNCGKSDIFKLYIPE